MIYVGKSFTARLRGSRMCPVVCEKCQTSFVYELIRQGVGRGSAPYYIGQASAAARAEAGARKMLEKRLNREREPVACPGCNWVNADLIVGYRKTRYRNLATGGIAIALGLGFVAFVSVLLSGHRYENNTMPAILSAATVAIVIGGGCVGLQWLLRSRINFNKSFPNQPKLPAGTPKGYTEQELTSVRQITQSGRFVPADAEANAYPGWIVFRAGHLALPRVCCECLAPATTAIPSGSADQLNRFAVPLCGECDSRIKASKRWIYLQACIAVTIVTGMTYFAVPGKADDRVAATVVAAIFSAIAAWIIASRLGRPFKLRRVDAARGVSRLQFRSEQYNEMVRQATAAHEAAPFQPPTPVLPMN